MVRWELLLPECEISECVSMLRNNSHRDDHLRIGERGDDEFIVMFTSDTVHQALS